MKKILIFILLPLLYGFTLLSTGLGYEIITSNIENIDGLSHHAITANVYNDSGTESKQNIHVLKHDGTLETTVWSVTNTAGTVQNRDIIKIAEDFEMKNPNYEVLGGINGDYFTTNQTINANMIFGSRMMNPSNHIKYASIEMDRYGTFINVHNQIAFNELYAYFYDPSSDALLYVTELLPLNTRIVADGQTAAYYNYSSISSTALEHYSLSILQRSIIGAHSMFYLKAPVSKQEKIETTTDKVSIVSTNSIVNDFLELGVNVKIQRAPNGIFETHTLVGIGSQVLENGTIKSFESIGDQSLEFARARHPRTGIAFDSDNKPMLITVDGRFPGVSEGVNLRELAYLMHVNGAVNGFNLDGGGSTQAFVKKDGNFSMVNNPSNSNPYRSVANAILFIKPKDSQRVIQTAYADHLQLTLPSLNYNVYVNGQTVYVNSNNINIPLNPYEHQAISVVNKQTQTAIFSKILYQSLAVGPTLPEFDISHEILNNKLHIRVNFTDPDFLIDKMNVLHEQNGIQRVALVQYMGLRRAIFDEIYEGENSFIVYYELKNGNKGQLQYYFVHNINIESPITDEPNNSDDANQIMYVIVVMTSLILFLSVLTVIIVRKKL